MKLFQNNRLVIIAGPCVIENEELIISTSEAIKAITDELNLNLIFKSSFRKANRTNLKSFMGIGDEKALKILANVKEKLGVPIITDVHSTEDVKLAAKFVDVLQIPAFLSRQTDLLIATGRTGKYVNIKKGQFLAPEDMKQACEKVESTGNHNIMLTERGTSFGYHNLVVDMRSLVIMKKIGYPIVMDATHSVQLPSLGNISGGSPEFIKPLAKAATAIGIDALFLEVHPNPAEALSDSSCQLPLSELKDLLIEIKAIDQLVKKY